MASFASVDALNTHLKTRSYITGYSLSEDDVKAFSSLSASPAASTHPYAHRWALHIAALKGSSVAFLGNAPAVAPKASQAKPTAKASAKKEEDFDDMFGGEEEEVNEDGETATEAAATKARQERMALALKLKQEKDAKEGKVKSEKPKPVEKSLVVLEVKPWEADTDLKMVWGKIREYQQEGLSWGETYKLEPVAFGIMKLVMTCTIVDSLVLMDDVTENIEALEEWVQSVQVASMNKIS